MSKSEMEIKRLIAEIERLKLENAILRRAAGIHGSSESDDAQTIQVSQEERNALFQKSV